MEAMTAQVYEPAPGDNRRYGRHALRLPISVKMLTQALGDDAPSPAAARTYSQSAFLHNISLSGLCFTSSRVYEASALLELRLPLWAREYRIQGVVRRSYMEQNDYLSIHRTAVQYVHGGDIDAFIPALAQYLDQSRHRRLR